jgi:hypothetical protein
LDITVYNFRLIYVSTYLRLNCLIKRPTLFTHS